ncbi:hypothetical protein ACTFIW_011707 [Dictyostelium discoideum]
MAGAYPVSTPFNYPQPYILRLQDYKMVGPVLTQKNLKRSKKVFHY